MSVLDTFRLTGKVAVVTGGNRGLGKVFALALGQAGATIAILARDADRTARVVEELAGQDLEAHGYQGDVTNRADVDGAAEQIVVERGRVDVLVNNDRVGELIDVLAPAPASTARPWTCPRRTGTRSSTSTSTASGTAARRSAGSG